MRKTFKNNEKLIVRLKKGDRKAFGVLVETYHHKLCVYANSLCNDYALAEDIVQNTFIKVWERRKMLNENYSLNSYLYKLVYNEFIDQYRKNQAVMLIEKKYVEFLNVIIDENEDQDTRKLINLVMESIEELPSKCKKVFLMSKKEGLTNPEISEFMHISIKSVEGHITKAFKFIKKNVRDKMGSSYVLFINFDSFWIKNKSKLFTS